MGALRLGTAVGLALLLTGCASPAAPTPSVTCPDPAPMAHVYHSYRLHVLAACVSAMGTVELVRQEPDGDVHIRLRLDAGQALTNAANDSGQRGDLVLEIVCVGPVTQADAQDACSSYQNALMVPAIGQHIAASGPWVTDADHGWNEIHPVETLGR